MVGGRRDWNTCTRSAVPKSAETVAQSLRRQAMALNRYLTRIEALHSAKAIPKADLKYAYAGAFVTFYTATESSVEDLFLGLLMGRISPPRASIRPLVSIDSEVVARKVLRGERAFVDWLPYDRTTRKRAKAFFSRGRPFSSLGKAHRKSLERAAIIRNAIAHRSGSSQRLFITEFVEGKPLPPAERRPTGYLRGFHAPGQRRIALQFAEVLASVDALCA